MALPMLAKDMKTPQYQKENENIVLMCLLKATKEIDVPFSIFPQTMFVRQIPLCAGKRASKLWATKVSTVIYSCAHVYFILLFI